MKRRILVLTFIFILFALPVYAEILELDTMPNLDFHGLEYRFEKADSSEFISKEVVINEVYWLQETLPFLQKVNYSVYLVGEVCTRDTVNILGLSNLDTLEIYLFAIPQEKIGGQLSSYIKTVTTEHTIDHEIGHLLRYSFLSDEILLDYYKMRGGNIEEIESLTELEELFADDFAYLFGSPDLFPITFNDISFKTPGEKEKQWIITNLTLGFYKKFPEEGKKEILRARPQSRQRTPSLFGGGFLRVCSSPG